MLAARRCALLVRSLQWKRKIQCGNSCRRMLPWFELFRAAFLFIWCVNGVPTLLFSIHPWNGQTLDTTFYVVALIKAKNNRYSNRPLKTSKIVVFRNAGELWNGGGIAPLPFQKGETRAEVPFHNRIVLRNFMVYQDWLETIQLTSCKRFDNNCYHLQCIAMITVVIETFARCQLYRLLWP